MTAAAAKFRVSARCNSSSEHGSSSRSGNTADPATVPDQVETLRRSFGLRRLVLIGDRGMLTDARIKDPRPYPGLGWISALRSDPLRRLVEEGTLQPSLFDATNLAAIRSSQFPGELLAVCHPPLLAVRRKHSREDLLRRTEQEFQRIQREILRRTRNLLTATEIGVKVSRVRNGFNMARHFRTRIEDSLHEYARKAAGIEREAALDGLYIVHTSETGMPAEDAVRGYQKLVRVDQAFRCLKSVDLKVRPIHHRAERQSRAHLVVCMQASSVEWHLWSAPAPLLLQREDPEDRQAERGQVAAAQEKPPHEPRRSAVAQHLKPAAGACDARPPPVPDAERSQGTALDPADGSHSTAEASHGTVARVPSEQHSESGKTPL